MLGCELLEVNMICTECTGTRYSGLRLIWGLCTGIAIRRYLERVKKYVRAISYEHDYYSRGLYNFWQNGRRKSTKNVPLLDCSNAYDYRVVYDFAESERNVDPL